MARPNLHATDRPAAAADQRLLHALGVPFARAAETSSTGFALVDGAGTVQWASAAFSRLTRVTGALLGAPLPERLSERFRLADGEAAAVFDSVAAGTLELIEGRSGIPVLLHVAKRDGEQRVVVAVAADPDRAGGATGAIDETTTDPLCRLGNRHLLEQRLAGPVPATSSLALIVVGIDHFVGLNETLGRLACDEVLALLADRLRRLCRSDDLLVRLHGDTFAILHDASLASDATARIATRVLATFDEPLRTTAHTVRIDGSIGIARQGRATTTRADLVDHALAGLAAAKRAGGGTWRDYEPGADRG